MYVLAIAWDPLLSALVGGGIAAGVAWLSMWNMRKAAREEREFHVKRALFDECLRTFHQLCLRSACSGFDGNDELGGLIRRLRLHAGRSVLTAAGELHKVTHRLYDAVFPGGSDGRGIPSDPNVIKNAEATVLQVTCTLVDAMRADLGLDPLP